MAVAMTPRPVRALLFSVMVLTSKSAFADGRKDAASSPEGTFQKLNSYDRPGSDQELFGSWRSPTMAQMLLCDLSCRWARGLHAGQFL